MGYFIAFIVGFVLAGGGAYFGRKYLDDAVAAIQKDFGLIHERISKVEVIAQDAAKKATIVVDQASADVKKAASDLPVIK